MSKIILVTGPSGAGKTSVCNVLASNLNDIWAHINQDDIRYLIKSGFRTSRNGVDAKTQIQIDVGFKICCDIIKRYDENGINCIAEVFAPAVLLNNWTRALNDILDLNIVLLKPNLMACLQRNSFKLDNAILTDEQVRRKYEFFLESYGNKNVFEIDTTDLSIEDVINLITKKYNI